MGEPLSRFWHGVGRPGSMDGWVGGRGLRGPGCWPWVQGEQSQLGFRGCPSPWHLSMQTGGWLWNPKLAPSECCPQPPVPPTCTPWGGQAPGSQAAAWAGCQQRPSPRRACHLPRAMWLVPKHGLGITWVLSRRQGSSGANCSPGGLKSSRLGTASCGSRTTLTRGAMVLPRCRGSGVASHQGTGGQQGKRPGGLGLGTGAARGPTTPPDPSPPTDTVHQGSQCCLGVPRKVPQSLAPAAGTAMRPWQCLLLAALGVQRRAPADSQLPVR